MDRPRLVEHLMMAERHVAEGEVHIARQRALIARMAQEGQDTSLAIDLLRLFRELQALHVADRDRLREALHQQ